MKSRPAKYWAALWCNESGERLDIDVVYNEDCLGGMKRIPDESIDMILCDLPYGTTARMMKTE